VKSQDNRCFELAVLSAMYSVDSNDHANRLTKYQTHLDKLSFTCISFPVKLTDIAKFERQNPTLLVNVFGWNACLYPVYVSKHIGREIDLLLIVTLHYIRVI